MSLVRMSRGRPELRLLVPLIHTSDNWKTLPNSPEFWHFIRHAVNLSSSIAEVALYPNRFNEKPYLKITFTLYVPRENVMEFVVSCLRAWGLEYCLLTSSRRGGQFSSTPLHRLTHYNSTGWPCNATPLRFLSTNMSDNALSLSLPTWFIWYLNMGKSYTFLRRIISECFLCLKMQFPEALCRCYPCNGTLHGMDVCSFARYS